MPSFKPKTAKKIKINKKNAITLDTKHKEFLKDFNVDEQENIPKWKKERRELKIKVLENDFSSMEQKMDIQDRIQELNFLLKQAKEKKTEYFLDNSNLLFDYFENKKNIVLDSSICSDATAQKHQKIEMFFKLPASASSIENTTESESATINTSTENNPPITKHNNIVQEYLSNVDDSFLEVKNCRHVSDVCNHCFRGELIPFEDEGMLICTYCSYCSTYLIENDKPSYKEPPKEICFYAYKRINHFKEIISQFQGKETTQISPEVIENIKLQIKKERIDITQITNQKTKEVLKKLGYNKYYEHIPFIKNKLGIPPPLMSAELEETLFNLFMELQAPYSKFCPNNRVNFLNYYYTAYKLCELLKETEYLPFFPMLKDREKRVEQDNIWKNICAELNWVFIPTI